jgi:hypothetical protein
MFGPESTIDAEGRLSRRTIMIVAGAAALALAAVVVAALIVRARRDVGIDVQNLARVESQLEQTLEGCAQAADPEACRQRKVQLAANATGAVSVCAHLDGADRDACVWEVARQRGDPEACAGIIDAVRAATCADGLFARLAVADSDASLCTKISSESSANACALAVAGPTTAANCAESGESAEACEALSAYELAAASMDPARCRQLADEEYANRCLERVGSGDLDHDGLSADAEEAYGTSDASVDSDADGLSDADEVNVYGTDPSNPDTDGDGYPDGSEVENGYDPNGPGHL